MWDRQNNIIRRSAHVVPAADGTQDCFAGINQGTIPSARLVMSSQPSDADTIGIGGKTFKFLNTLIAADTTVQVKIGASAAATLASLVKAINGTAAPAEWVESTTPFAVAVVADAVSTSLRIRLATARGGVAKAGVSGSVALAESITAAADIWSNANLNETGKSPADCNEACGQFAVTAQMVTNLANGIFIELPFAPTVFQWEVLTSAGVGKWTVTDAMTVSGNALVLTSAGATHVAAGDVLSYWASA
jgi:hypothetical protein